MLKHIAVAAALDLYSLPQAHAEARQAVKVLIVSGGSCHDQPRQGHPGGESALRNAMPGSARQQAWPYKITRLREPAGRERASRDCGVDQDARGGKSGSCLPTNTASLHTLANSHMPVLLLRDPREAARPGYTEDGAA